MTASDRDAETDEPRPLVHERPSAVSPYIRRIVADNPGPMTGAGTNTYLVGVDEVVVIDPGPDSDEHLEAVAGCGSGRIRWILLTHTHPDHHPGTARLAERTGAEVCAYDGRDGVAVDRCLGHGDVVETTEVRLRAVHTPGHASNHLCFLLEEERTLFTGDHIMDGSTVVIAPPDGNMTDYLDSLAAVRGIDRLRALAPGHGHLITDPVARIDGYIAHRLERERQILDFVRDHGTTAVELVVDGLYPGLVDVLVPRARQSVHAHLLRLAELGMVTGSDADGVWAPTA